MATPNIHLPENTLAKLGSLDVSVTEVEPELATPEFEKLTIHHPIHLPNPGKPRGIMPPEIISCPPGDIKRHLHPRPSSPTGSVRSSFSSRRHVSRTSHSHWSGGFSRTHRSEVSKELTAQAESEFLALMELMSSMSRRSSSLREVWTKIISERESFCLEMDRMHERFEEYTEIIERKEKEQHSHHHEHEERKKEITKLRLEIAAAVSTTSEYKRKITERERELTEVRREVAEFKDNFKYLKEEHEETKTSLEETRLQLVAVTEKCHDAEEDAKKHHGELRSLNQKYVELQSSHTEITSKYESTYKEVTQLKQSNSTLKKEKHEWMHEKGELEEGLRRCNHRNDELKRKVKELTEIYEKKTREVHELKETVSKWKYEKEELEQRVLELKRELEDEHCKWEDAEDRCGKWKLKWEHCDRELISVREEVRLIEIQRTEIRETLTKKTEEIRLLIIEKERLQEDYHHECKKAEDNHRQVLLLQETVRRSETTIKEKSELIHTLHERVERIEGERDEYRSKCNDLSVEISELKTSLVSINLELETITEERESIRERLHECETKYEEVCESVTEYHEGSSGFEYEISSLRTMLREVREQKEKAITMRNSADRERDEAIVRYEAKCREVEKLEESLSHHYHHGHGHGHGHNHGHGHGHGKGHTVTRYYNKSSSHTHNENGDHDDSESIAYPGSP